MTCTWNRKIYIWIKTLKHKWFFQLSTITGKSKITIFNKVHIFSSGKRTRGHQKFKNQMAHVIDKRIQDICLVSSSKLKFDTRIFVYLQVLWTRLCVFYRAWVGNLKQRVLITTLCSKIAKISGCQAPVAH